MAMLQLYNLYLFKHYLNSICAETDRQDKIRIQVGQSGKVKEQLMWNNSYTVNDSF